MDPNTVIPAPTNSSEPLATQRHQCGRGPASSTLDWRQSAACRGRDPELWFSALPADRDLAAGICASCPVQVRCLATALTFEAATGGGSHGLWGGYSERDRRQTLDTVRSSSRRGRSRWGSPR